jgi:hypothetical protein
MTVVTNNGCLTPTFPSQLITGDEDFIWMSWDLFDGETIVSSAWVLPTGFTSLSEATNQTVSDEDGFTYTDANVIELTTTLTSGTHEIRNVIVTTDRGQLTGAVRINVKV